MIAGMGGELIVQILSHAPWVRDPGKRLILQPMSKAEVLRSYLSNEGFAILQEEAVRSLGRIYSVMRCGYTGKKYSPEFWTSTPARSNRGTGRLTGNI